MPYFRLLLATAAAVIVLACGTAPASACSRAVYANPAGTAITGRNMDWHEDLRTNLWVLPRGMKRDGAVKDNPLAWVSKYGSVIATAYDIGTVDGMNEKGLTANVLFLRETDYGRRDAARPGMSVALWAQYYLDNFASVAEAVDATKDEPFQIETFAYGIHTETLGSLHMALSDKSGDSAILEYLGGKLVIHHSRNFNVLTNSPPLPQQLKRMTRYQGLGGTDPLPSGEDSPQARFARAVYNVRNIPATASPGEALAQTRNVLLDVTKPYGGYTAKHGARSLTIWRTIADAGNGIYYFTPVVPSGEKTLSVEFARLDFSEGAPVKTLPVSDGKPREGEMSGEFAPAQPFTFRGP